MKRLFDILFAVLALTLTAPLFAGAALAVRVSSPGPVFYPALRVGRDGKVFKMLKLRSMHLNIAGSAITTQNDVRVFTAGRILRLLKLDEIPQFINVLKGDMSIVGPRPEDPQIVDVGYVDWMRETLKVRPGITGPGSIYFYGGAEALIDKTDPVGSYIRDLLPPKLAIERAYLDRATFVSDLVCIGHTALAIIGAAIGRPVPPLQVDMLAAGRFAKVPDLTSRSRH